MDLDDVSNFKGPQRHKSRHDPDDSGAVRYRRRHDDDPDMIPEWARRRRDDSDDDRDERSHDYVAHVLPRLLAHKKLLILSGVVLVLVLVGIGPLVLPLVWQAMEYLRQNGVQGAIDRIWSGRGS